MLRPSIQPKPRRPSRKASKLSLLSGSSADPPVNLPTRWSLCGCCAAADAQSAKNTAQSTTSLVVLLSWLMPVLTGSLDPLAPTLSAISDSRWFDFAHHWFSILRRGSGHVLDFRLFGHLITRSALARTLGGIVNPICFAAFRLMTNSNFVGCSTGRSPGLAPFRILST
jgi:hypothetical protein